MCDSSCNGREPRQTRKQFPLLHETNNFVNKGELCQTHSRNFRAWLIAICIFIISTQSLYALPTIGDFLNDSNAIKKFETVDKQQKEELDSFVEKLGVPSAQSSDTTKTQASGPAEQSVPPLSHIGPHLPAHDEHTSPPLEPPPKPPDDPPDKGITPEETWEPPEDLEHEDEEPAHNTKTLDQHKEELVADEESGETTDIVLPSENTDLEYQTLPPEGFEDLFSPEDTLVDVYFGGVRRGSALVTLTPENIEFESPEELIVLLPGLTDPGRVTAALSGALPTNSKASCYPVRHDGCGELDVDIAGVIVTPDIFRADIIVHHTLLSLQGVEETTYIPSPDNGLSTLLGVNGVISGSGDTGPAYSMSGQHIIAYNAQSFTTQANYNDTDRFSVSNMFATRYNKDNEYKAGFFTPEDLRLIRTPDIMGLSASRFLENRENIQTTYDSDIQVTLPYRSRVNLYKVGDDRILDSRIYSSGNHLLNTSRLPAGVYDVKVEIIDYREQPREEIHFFIKTDRLPPRDTLLYWAQMGILQDKINERRTPTYEDKAIARFGIGKRITEKMGLFGNIVTSEGETALEAGLEYQNNILRVVNDYLVTTERDIGTSGQLELKYKDFVYNVSGRRILSRAESTIPQEEVGFDPVTNSTTTFNTSLNYNLGPARLGLEGRWSRNSGNDYRFSYGPKVRWTAFRKNRMNVDVDSSITKSDDDLRFLTNVRVFFSKGRWSYTNSLRKEYISQDIKEDDFDKQPFNSNTTLTWQDNDLFNDDLTVSFNQEYTGADNSQGIDLDYRNRFGRLDLDTTFVEEDTQYAANLQFNIASNNRHFAIGGKDQRNSAIIVDIDGEAGDALFDININGGRKATVKSGTRTTIAVSPFDTYSVNLTPVGGALADISREPKVVSVYPGTVHYLEWKAQESIILLGQAIFRDSSPVADALISSSLEESLTDEEGFFQVYMYKEDIIKFTLPDGGECRISLPADTEIIDAVAAIDTAVCEMHRLPGEAIPEDELVKDELPGEAEEPILKSDPLPKDSPQN